LSKWAVCCPIALVEGIRVRKKRREACQLLKQNFDVRVFNANCILPQSGLRLHEDIFVLFVQRVNVHWKQRVHASKLGDVHFFTSLDSSFARHFQIDVLRLGTQGFCADIGNTGDLLLSQDLVSKYLQSFGQILLKQC
jgi:hypothetical protein